MVVPFVKRWRVGPHLPGLILLLLLTFWPFAASGAADVPSPSPTPSSTASPSPTPSPTVSPSPLATPIAITDVAAQADATQTGLHDLDFDAIDRAKIAGIKDGLKLQMTQSSARSKETTKILQSSPSLTMLSDLGADWQAFADQLLPWQRELGAYAAENESNFNALNRTYRAWESTRDLAITSGASDEVLAGIGTTLADIDRVRGSVEARRAQIQTLQNQAVAEAARVAGELHKIQQADDSTISRLIVRDSPALWSTDLSQFHGQDLLQNLSDALWPQWQSLNDYVRLRAERIPFHIAIFGLLVLALWLARGGARRWVAEDPGLNSAAVIFEMPIATALLLVLLISPWIYPHSPRALRAMLVASALLPTIHILRRLLDRHLYPLLNALIVFYFIDRLREVAAVFPLWERFMYLGEMLGGVIFVLWLLRRQALSPNDPATTVIGSQHTETIILRVALLVFAAAFVTNLLGYVGMAHYTGEALLGSTYIAGILYAGMRVLSSLMTFGLLLKPLQVFMVVKHNNEILRHRLEWLIRWLAVLAWVLVTLQHLALRAPLLSALRAILTARLSLGSLQLTLGDILAFALTLWASFLVSRFIRFVLKEDVYTRVKLDSGVPYTLSRLLHYVILLIGFFVAMAAMGVNLDRFTVLTGAFGVGAGFGLQNIISNFVSGLILLFERPIKLGDSVELEGNKGTITNIGIRASVLRTGDGAEIILPNSNLISGVVTNWTLSDQQRSIEITVGVAYDADFKQVLELLVSVARQQPLILANPPPQALFTSFGDSSVVFKLKAWTDRIDVLPSIFSELGLAINAALKANNIEMPFPQRDLHLRSIDAEAGKLLHERNREPDQSVNSGTDP